MQELLLGTWWPSLGAPALAWSVQHPWAVFAAVLVFILALDLIRNRRRASGDAGLFDLDFGDGDGGGCGD